MNTKINHQFSLTAIMPVRNSKLHEGNIYRILKSVSGLPIQLILVLDTHSPETEIRESVLLEAVQDEHTLMISEDFDSPGLARNAGLTLAKSSYVTFWDCDDIPDPEKFLELTQILKNRNAEIAVGSFQLEDLNLIMQTSIQKRDLIAELTLQPGIWRMVFDTNKLRLPDFRDFKMAEDLVFLVDLEFENRHILREEINVYTYRRNSPGQLTRSSSAIKDSKRSLHYMLEVYLAGNGKLRNQKLLKAFIVKLILSGFKHKIFSAKSFKWLFSYQVWSLGSLVRLLALFRQVLIQLKRKVIG